MDLANIEDCFKDDFFLNFKVNIVPTISCLPKLFVGHNICVETGDVGNVLKQKELLIYRRVNINLDLAIALYI